MKIYNSIYIYIYILLMIFIISCSGNKRDSNSLNNIINNNNSIVHNNNNIDLNNNINNKDNNNSVNNNLVNNSENNLSLNSNNQVESNNINNSENLDNNINGSNNENTNNVDNTIVSNQDNIENNKLNILPKVCTEVGPSYTCETDGGLMKRVTPDDKPSISVYDEWGVTFSDRFVAWTKRILEPDSTSTIVIYDRCNCEILEPFVDKMNPPDGFTLVGYAIPRISKKWMIYSKLLSVNNENSEAHKQFWVVNLDTGENKMITTQEHDSNATRLYNDTDDNYSVWKEYNHDSGLNGVHVYNLNTNEDKYIATDIPGGKSNLSIWGDYISWLGCWDGIDYCDVFLYQISTEVLSNITQSGGYDGDHVVTVFPNMNHNRIVWSDGRNSDGEISQGYAKNYDIYMYDIETAQQTQLTDTSYQEIKPWVSKRYIAYMDGRDYDRPGDWYIKWGDLIVKDLETGKELRFDRGTRAERNYCNTYNAPRIEGNYLMFKYLGRCDELNRQSNFYSDLYLVDLQQLDWDSGVIAAPVN